MSTFRRSASLPTNRRSVPTGSNPQIEDRAGYSLSRDVASSSAALDLCTTIIRSTPRRLLAARPFDREKPEGDFEQEQLDDVKTHLNEAYTTIHYPVYAPLAFRLVEPYLRLTDILPVLYQGVDAIFTTRLLDRIPMLELLIQGHELTLRPEEPADEITPTPGMRLLDVIYRHETYLPITSRQTFFPFGSRFGSGSIKEYAQVWDQLQDDADELRDRGLISRFYLELVLCVVKHLRGH